MSIIQPGIGGGIQGRGVSAQCGQGGRRSAFRAIGGASGNLGRSRFRSPLMLGRFGVSGITRNAAGVALAGVTVDVYSESRVWIDRTVSDGSGAFAFTNLGVGRVFLIATKEDVPEVTGTSVHAVGVTAL